MSGRFNQQDFLEKDKLEVSSFLIYNKKYREISNNAKFMYQYLIKRFSLTEHKMMEAMEGDNLEEFTFIDKEGDLFCICSNDELRFVLGISEGTVIKCKKELVEVKLVEEQKQTAHLSNRLYVNKVTMNPSDKKNFKSQLTAFREVEKAKRKKKNIKRMDKVVSSKKSELQKLKFTEPQNLEFNELQNLEPSTKEDFSTKELNSSKGSFVNKDKETLIGISNTYYAEFASTRWTKKQWNALIISFINELIADDKRLHSIVNVNSYIKGAIKNMAYKYDLKNGRVELPSYFESDEKLCSEAKNENSQNPLEESDSSTIPSSYYFDWMDEE